MGAMKRLRDEWTRSGWNLSGFKAEHRPLWRRLLPPELAGGDVAEPEVELELEPLPKSKDKGKQASLF